MSNTRVSSNEAAFVFGEDDRIPLHVGGLTIVEAGPLLDELGVVDIERIRNGVLDRLHLLPRFRQRLAEVPFDQGRPVWVDDTHFDVERHLYLTSLPRPGGRRELNNLMGRLMSQVMDRSRPLWECWFVDGLAEDDRLAIITKIHHSTIDGTSGVELGTLIFDITPEGTPIERQPWTPDPEPSGSELLRDAVVDRTLERLGDLRTIVDGMLHPSKPIGHALHVVNALGGLTSDVDPLPFNDVVTSNRGFETTTFPLDPVLAVKRRYEVTVNDVVLAALTGALREYCSARGIDPDSLTRVKAIVPVDVRAEDDKELGVQASSIFAELPMGEHDPVARLRWIHAHVDELKRAEQADGTLVWPQLMGKLPVRLLRRSSQAQFRGLMKNGNLMVSNVKGPPSPFYAYGARVLEVYPYFGVSDHLGLIVIVFSYNEQVCVGLCTDPELMPDVGVLADAIPKAFAELDATV